MGQKKDKLHADIPNPLEVLTKIESPISSMADFDKEKIEIGTALSLAAQEKKIKLATVEEDTRNATEDLAESSDTEYQNILTHLPEGLQDINKQLKFTAYKGKTKEIRQIAREYRKEFVKDMKYTCRTLGIYFRKVRNGRFDENMITPEQMTILNAKTQARHDKIKGFIGDTLTGDNMFAERGNKKDVFVGPDMNTSTDGVEVRGAYTTEQVNAMASTCTQPQTAEWKKKYYGMIDKNINIPIFGNTGNQVVKTSLKLLPDIVRLGIGIKYGIDTVKGIFGLFSKDGRTPEALWQLTKSAGILSLAAFTDIDKASAYVGSRFSNASKTYSNNGESNIGSNAEIISGLSALKPGESLPFGYGETLMGKAFAVPGVTVGEVNQEQIITYNGNRPIGINFSKLKKLYSNKMNSNQADIPKYTQAISNVNDLEIAYSKLKTKEQREEFMDTMTKVGMSKEVFENPELNDKEVSLFMASAMKTAEILPELGQRLIISDKIYSNKDVESYISANSGKEKFMDEIMKLPDNIRLGIEKGEIVLSVKDNKLCISSMNNESILDLSTKELYDTNRNGEFIKLPLQLTDTTELLVLGQEQNRIRNTFQKTSLYPRSFFLDKSGNDVEFMKGPRDWKDPTSRRFGQKETALAGGLGSGLFKTMPKINDNMKLFIDYQNSLDLWMTDAIHDKYIQLVELIKIHLPNLKPGTAEYDAIVLSLLHLSTMPTASEITGMVKEGKDIRIIFKDGSKKLFSDLVGGMNISDRRNANHKMASIGTAIGGVIYGTGEGIINLWKGFYKASGIKTGVDTVADKISDTRDGIFGTSINNLSKAEQKEYFNLINKTNFTATEEARLKEIAKKLKIDLGTPKEILSVLQNNKNLSEDNKKEIARILRTIGPNGLAEAEKKKAIAIIKATLNQPHLTKEDKQKLAEVLIGLEGEGYIHLIQRKMKEAQKAGGEWFIDPDTGEWRLKKAGGQIVDRSAWAVSEGLENAAYGLGRFMVGIKTAVIAKIRGLGRGVLGIRNEDQRLDHHQEGMVLPEIAYLGKDRDNSEGSISNLQGSDRTLALQKVAEYQNRRKKYELDTVSDIWTELESGKSDMQIAQDIFSKLYIDSDEEGANDKKWEGDKESFVQRIQYIGILRDARDGKINTSNIKLSNSTTITDNKEKLRYCFPQQVDKIVMGCYMVAKNRLFDTAESNGKIGTSITLGTSPADGAKEVYRQVTGKEASTKDQYKLTIIQDIITYISNKK